MLRYIKEGFRTTYTHTFLLLVLWLYHFTCGFLLLMLVKSVVVPLMHRYPGGHLPSASSQLFLAESQFRLMKTDISYTYLWLLLALIAVRMAITPLLNAGVYFSLHNPQMNSGYRFFQGIKRLGRPFFGYYIVQMLLSLAPLYWLIPFAGNAFMQMRDYSSLALALLPWIGGYTVYCWLLRLAFMFIQLGKTAEATIWGSIVLFLRKFPVIATLALILLGLSGVVTVAALSASLLWAGLSAVLLQQLFHLAQMLFKLWTISTQYHVYAEHAK